MECVGRGDGIQFEKLDNFQQWDDLDRHERIRLSEVTAMVRKDRDAKFVLNLWSHSVTHTFYRTTAPSRRKGGTRPNNELVAIFAGLPRVFPSLTHVPSRHNFDIPFNGAEVKSRAQPISIRKISPSEFATNFTAQTKMSKFRLVLCYELTKS